MEIKINVNIINFIYFKLIKLFLSFILVFNFETFIVVFLEIALNSSSPAKSMVMLYDFGSKKMFIFAIPLELVLAL